MAEGEDRGEAAAPEKKTHYTPSTGAFAVAASRRMPLWAAVAITAFLVFGGGWLLYLARGGIAEALVPPGDELTFENPETAAPAVDGAPDTGTGESEGEEPPGPELTASEIRNLLAELPQSFYELIAEGREELPEFRGLDPDDPTQALILQNRWSLWGRAWQNRLNLIRQRMPPAEQCAFYPELAATCFEYRVAAGLLESVTRPQPVDDALACLDDAEALVAQLEGNQL